MPGGTAGWIDIAAPNVTRTATGYVTHGVAVTFAQVMSPDGEPPPTRYDSRILTLLEEYGAICALAGVVIPIGSLYRSLHYQNECFHTKRAEHTVGRAMDLLSPVGWTVGRVAVIVLERRRERASRLGPVGIAPSWVHAEISPIPHRNVWRWPTDRRAD